MSLCYLALNKVVVLHKKLEVVKQGIKEAEHGVILKFNQNISVAAITVVFPLKVVVNVGGITEHNIEFYRILLAK